MSRRRLLSLISYTLSTWVLLVLSSYHIFVGTIGLSRSSINAPGDVYEAEFFPPKSHRQMLDDKIASYPRAAPRLSNVRALDESRLPFPCGVIFFYHIPCTGGYSMNQWLKGEKRANENVTYWTYWGRIEQVQESFIAGMEEQIRDIGHRDWRIVQAHGFSLYPNTSEPFLYYWREEVEAQGCAFVATTMLRDAVGHTISQLKNAVKAGSTPDEYLAHLDPENSTERGRINTQLDYLVYNRGPRNKHNVSREEKVRRGMELLQRHFDVVLLSDHERFVEIMRKVTGWVGNTTMGYENVYRRELTFTERELKRIKTLTEANGDVMFIDAVKHIYYGHLDYLLA